tara:strand:+ start:1361 stop:1567 length:207 start_codon:yes stop_codon:yes gene_type:complete
MFKCILVLCSTFFGNCQIIEDTRGPYETLEECNKRAYEIVKDMSSMIPTYRAQVHFCLELKKEKGYRL